MVGANEDPLRGSAAEENEKVCVLSGPCQRLMTRLTIYHAPLTQSVRVPAL